MASKIKSVLSHIGRRAPPLPSPNSQRVKAGTDLFAEILPPLNQDSKTISSIAKSPSVGVDTLEKGWGAVELEERHPAVEIEGVKQWVEME